MYTTVGLYEGIAVRLASGRNLRRQAFRTAVIANPLGRAIGVAMVSGGALRYRMYAPEGLSIREVGAIYKGNLYVGEDLMEIPFDAPAPAKLD